MKESIFNLKYNVPKIKCKIFFKDHLDTPNKEYYVDEHKIRLYEKKFNMKIEDFIPKICMLRDINEENVHRVEKFLQIVNENLGDERSYKKVSINHLKNIITNKKGLFKISIGEKILFINKCENEKSIINAKKLINKLKNETNIDKLIYGSVIEDKFTDLY